MMRLLKLCIPLLCIVLLALLIKSLVPPKSTQIPATASTPKPQTTADQGVVVALTGSETYVVASPGGPLSQEYREWELASALRELVTDDDLLRIRCPVGTPFGQMLKLMDHLSVLGYRRVVTDSDVSISLHAIGASHVSVFCRGEGSFECQGKVDLDRAMLLTELMIVRRNSADRPLPPVVVRSAGHTPWSEALAACQAARGAGFSAITCGLSTARPGEGPDVGLFDSLIRANHVCYVVDRSGAMIDTFDAVRMGLLISISRLTAKQMFHVLLMAEGPPAEAPPGRLAPADDNQKVAVAEFLDPFRAQGRTDPLPALNRAFDVLDKADPEPPGKIILLVTCGMPAAPDKLLQLARERNAKQEVIIHTFMVGPRQAKAEAMFKRLAEENGGRYRYVSPDE